MTTRLDSDEIKQEITKNLMMMLLKLEPDVKERMNNLIKGYLMNNSFEGASKIVDSI